MNSFDFTPNNQSSLIKIDDDVQSELNIDSITPIKSDELLVLKDGNLITPSPVLET